MLDALFNAVEREFMTRKGLNSVGNVTERLVCRLI